MVVASQREPLRLALDFFQLLSLSDDCRLQKPSGPIPALIRPQKGGAAC